MKTLLVCLAIAGVAAALTAGEAQATLLQDRFGVSPVTGSVSLGEETFFDVFLHDWTPTLNTETADHVADDWYGKGPLSFNPEITLFGSIPSGGEPYDVEAIYLDNDHDFLYLSIVTSFPLAGFTHPEVPSVHVPPGDICIGLDGGMYNFGIDIDGGTGMMCQTDVGDWYVWDESHAVAAQGELTNFSGGATVGPVPLTYQSMGLTENEFDTYLIEATVPLSYLGDPQDGTVIYVHWVCGCRNDASGSNPILKLEGDIDRDPLATEVATWSSLKAQFR